ncbi:hypothetical protein [Terasakiella pusilla]|jgi:TolA-binding protein|uniref:hypothetical protein n=1 Tax=Terasakiella pusilla TaxID=64973 RepID=UPI003AA972E1
MSGTATIAITVGVAVAVLVGFFIVYYLGNVANSIYDVKVGVRKDFDKKVKELQEWVDSDTKKRIKWMRDENKEEGKRFKEGMEGHLEETFGEMQKNIERLQGDVASLQMQVQNLQQGKGLQRPAPAYKRPTGTEEPSAGVTGEMEVARTLTPDQEEAPDMAVAKTGIQPDAAEGAAPSTGIRTKPTPPPRPSPKPQPAGRQSIEKKAQKKKKGPDEFESFNTFSEDFKAGS